MLSTKMILAIFMISIILSTSDACKCDGTSQYSYKFSKEIGHCGSTIPLYSPRARPWCFVHAHSSGCTDVRRVPHENFAGRFYSFDACGRASP